mmetsp:Transcript_28516/g.92020  ORF Transcript_28516/g.92020 Transcript_28516/m.92020 type:complete len:109 (-) Transcript_28516:494-820(-)
MTSCQSSCTNFQLQHLCLRYQFDRANNSLAINQMAMRFLARSMTLFVFKRELKHKDDADIILQNVTRITTRVPLKFSTTSRSTLSPWGDFTKHEGMSEAVNAQPRGFF